MRARLDIKQRRHFYSRRRLDLVALGLIAPALALAGCPDECFQEFGDRDCRFNQGETRCGVGENLNSVEECILDSGSGCHLWTESEACEGSLRCDPVEGACVCLDQCSHTGATSCVEVCLLTGEGCADWIAARDCATAGEGCEDADDGARCTGEASCVAECWTGETRCAGDTVEHCVDDGSGCLLWALGADCAALGQSCVTGPEGTWCEGEACSHDCDEAGRTRCSGATIQACEADGEGCRRWVDSGLCEEPTPTCDDSGGAAVCAGDGGEELICNDRIDNDGDGNADCLDSDCFDDPFCAAP